jgi:hypothetical protein
MIPSCTHRFCYPCIVNWSKLSNKCPLCKACYDKIFKIKCGEKISYHKVEEMGSEDGENHQGDEILVIEGTDEKCYVCSEVGDTTRLLVCDHCNFLVCHNSCLPEPIDWIPEEDFYCKDCCEKFSLKNSFEKPVPFNSELYLQIVGAGEPEEAAAQPQPVPGAQRRARRRMHVEDDAEVAEEDLVLAEREDDSQLRLHRSREERKHRIEKRQTMLSQPEVLDHLKYKPSPVKKRLKKRARRLFDSDFSEEPEDSDRILFDRKDIEAHSDIRNLIQRHALDSQARLLDERAPQPAEAAPALRRAYPRRPKRVVVDFPEEQDLKSAKLARRFRCLLQNITESREPDNVLPREAAEVPAYFEEWTRRPSRNK